MVSSETLVALEKYMASDATPAAAGAGGTGVDSTDKKGTILQRRLLIYILSYMHVALPT